MGPGSINSRPLLFMTSRHKAKDGNNHSDSSSIQSACSTCHKNLSKNHFWFSSNQHVNYPDAKGNALHCEGIVSFIRFCFSIKMPGMWKFIGETKLVLSDVPPNWYSSNILSNSESSETLVNSSLPVTEPQPLTPLFGHLVIFSFWEIFFVYVYLIMPVPNCL